MFYADLVVAMRDSEERYLPGNPLLKTMARRPSNECRRELAEGSPSEFEVEGDTARTTIPIGNGDVSVEFVFKKIDERWFLHIVDPDRFAASRVGVTFAAGGVFYP